MGVSNSRRKLISCSSVILSIQGRCGTFVGSWWVSPLLFFTNTEVEAQGHGKLVPGPDMVSLSLLVLVSAPQSQDASFSCRQGEARGKANEDTVGSCHFS